MLTLDQLEIGRSYILKTTGIKETEAVRGIRNATLCSEEKMEEVWYDLSGRRLTGQPTQRGIYIYQGKKIIK